MSKDPISPRVKTLAARMHQPKLVTSRHVAHHVHGGGRLGQLNAKLAVFITKNVGTMWCAYLFAVIGITGLVAALTNNVEVVLFVGALSGYFLQLVLLPVIIVGQNVQAAASDARAEADHRTINALHHLNKVQLEILEELKAKDEPAPEPKKVA